MEMAMPDSDIKFAFRPINFMGMKARASDTGMVTIGMIEDGKCHKKIRMMIETTIG